MTEPSAEPVASGASDDLGPYRPPSARPTRADEDLWEIARRGRRVVVILITPWILLQAFTVLRILFGTTEPVGGMSRVMMTALLGWFLYRGSDTARFLFTGLLALFIGSVLVALVGETELTIWQLVNLMAVLAFLICELVFLWWPRSVRMFFERGGPL